MTVKTEVVQGVLTTSFPAQLETVYLEGDYICLQFGRTQEEVVHNLGALDAAVGGLPPAPDAVPDAPMEPVVRVVDGMLTFFIPRYHEAVYRDEGRVCVRLGSSQVEVAQKLVGLEEALALLPTDAEQAAAAAQAARAALKAEAEEAEQARLAYERLPRAEKERIAALLLAEEAERNAPVYDAYGNQVPKP